MASSSSSSSWWVLGEEVLGEELWFQDFVLGGESLVMLAKRHRIYGINSYFSLVVVWYGDVEAVGKGGTGLLSSWVSISIFLLSLWRRDDGYSLL